MGNPLKSIFLWGVAIGALIWVSLWVAIIWRLLNP